MKLGRIHQKISAGSSGWSKISASGGSSSASAGAGRAYSRDPGEIGGIVKFLHLNRPEGAVTLFFLLFHETAAAGIKPRPEIATLPPRQGETPHEFMHACMHTRAHVQTERDCAGGSRRRPTTGEAEEPKFKTSVSPLRYR
jgi:hypothetical protein